jgi:hypothetical protein
VSSVQKTRPSEAWTGHRESWNAPARRPRNKESRFPFGSFARLSRSGQALIAAARRLGMTPVEAHSIFSQAMLSVTGEHQSPAQAKLGRGARG